MSQALQECTILQGWSTRDITPPTKQQCTKLPLQPAGPRPALEGQSVRARGLGGALLRQQALDAGATEFLVKPIDRAVLARILERHRLGQRGAESPASSHTVV